MRDEHARDAARDLRGRIERGVAPRQFAAQCEHEAHRRIEMRARHRPEDQDQHHQDRAGRQRVAEQRERDVSARKALAP